MDSRGQGLHEFISHHQPFPSSHHVQIIMKPGARIHDLFHASKPHLVDHPNSIVFLAGEICNLTEKIHHHWGTQLSYQSKTDSIIHEINEIDRTFREEFDQISFKIATIPPVSILKSTQYNIENGHLTQSITSHEEIKTQQASLENDLRIINQHIEGINSSRMQGTITLHNDLLKTKIKKRGNGGRKIRKTGYVYSRLYDGVHPDQKLKQKWFHLICRSLMSQSQVYSSESEDDFEEETWDFKRAKRS